MSTWRLGMLGTSVFCGFAGMLGACDSDNTAKADGSVGAIDAPPGDASGTDARSADAPGPDAKVGPTAAGTIGIHDVQLFGAPQAGHGGQINISFTKTGVPFEMKEGNTGIPPCYATLTDVTKVEQRNPGLDQGTVKITVKKGDGSNGTKIPDCTLLASGDYRCIGGQGAGGSFAAVTTGDLANKMYTLTDTSPAANFLAEQVGRWLIVVDPDAAKGAGLVFPIVGASGNKLGLQALGAVPLTALGTYIIAAGIGPVAFTANPDGTGLGAAPVFLNDTDKVSIELAPKTGADLPAFSATDIDVGDAFELDDATKARFMSGTPVDLNSTAALEFGCPSGKCGTAAGLIVVIDTSDAETYASATDLGKPKKYSASLTCARFDPEPQPSAVKVSIPANLIAILKAAHPTKMRVSVFRDNFSSSTAGNTNIVVGHGIIGFQAVTP